MPGRSITGALPALVFAYGELQAQMRPKGITFQIADFGGLRTQADTALIMRYRDDEWALYKKNNPTKAAQTTKEKWRPIAPWGKSMHNYGAAFDVEVVGTPAGMSRLEALNIIHDAGEKLGLNSGRDFGDPPHLELRFPGAPPGAAALAAAKAEWRKENGTDFFKR
jgi:hypothetical protein